MRFSLPRIGFALALACAVSLSGCLSSRKGTIPSGPPPPSTSFLVYVADLGSNDVRAVDPVSGNTVAVIPVGNAPSAIAFDGGIGQVPKYGFVANTADSTVSVIDPLGNTVVKTISVCKGPRALLAHHDVASGIFMYVACGDGNVDVISENSMAVFTTINVGGTPIGLAQADGNIIYSFAVLGSEGRLSIVQYDLGFSIAQVLQVQANPAAVWENYGDYSVASTDGVVQRFSNNNSNDRNVPFAFAEKNTSAKPFQVGTGLLYSSSAVLADTQNGNIQLFDSSTAAPGKLPGTAPMLGVAQTLTTGAGPRGAAAVNLTAGQSAGSYLFVANSNADSISQYSEQADLIAPPAFAATSTISLASGTHPVALAIYLKSAATPTPAPTPTATPTPAPTAAPTPTPVPTATPTSSAATRLYIANYGAGNVAQYAAPFSNTSVPSAKFSDTTPVGGPVGVAANATYVVTSHVTGSASAYQQPVSASSTPVATFGGSAMGLMTFDPQGNLWATSQNSSVVEYIPPFTNSTVEAKALTTGFTSSYGIAFDTSGKMYVTNSDSSANIVVYAPPYTSPSNTFAVSTPNAKLHGAAVNGSNLYVADTHNNLIYVYSLPMTTNVATEVFSATAPLGLAFDANGSLYVTSQGTNQVQIFNPPFNSGTRPSVTITSGVSQAFGIAVGP